MMIYNLSPIKVEELLQHSGFEVGIRALAYQIEAVRKHNIPEEMPNLGWLVPIARRQDTPYKCARRYLIECAVSARVARSRIHFGIQVAEEMAKAVPQLRMVRVVGAESRLENRSKERGIRDLDLALHPSKKRFNKSEVNKLYAVVKDAEEQTEIPIDFMGPGIPITADSMEHILSWQPLDVVGWPVWWEEKRWLDMFLGKVIRYFDVELPIALDSYKMLKERGLYGGVVYG